MRINAYVLAADPTWLQTSVARYYHHVAKIIVSYDEASLGWTGAPVKARQCIEALRQLDAEHKMTFVAGSYHHYAGAPARGDTEQRSAALALAAVDADWVLQIDTDEVLPDWGALMKVIEYAECQGIDAVEWPMRVLFRALPGGRFLEVRGPHGEPHYEYPGPIAVRGTARLVDCRRASGPFLRPSVRGDLTSMQIARPPLSGEQRAELLSAKEALWHNSWARSPTAVRRKIRAWGHHQGLRSSLYYWCTWLPAPLLWRQLRDLHPFARGLWPRLAVVDGLPFALNEEAGAAA